MSSWKINLKEQTATSINGITFKLTETKPGEYEGVCLNPKDIPPDDLDDVVLGRMHGQNMRMKSIARNIADQASSYLITSTGQPLAASLIFSSKVE